MYHISWKWFPYQLRAEVKTRCVPSPECKQGHLAVTTRFREGPNAKLEVSPCQRKPPARRAI